jgi:hypothetical protein
MHAASYHQKLASTVRENESEVTDATEVGTADESPIAGSAPTGTKNARYTPREIIMKSSTKRPKSGNAALAHAR